MLIPDWAFYIGVSVPGGQRTLNWRVVHLRFLFGFVSWLWFAISTWVWVGLVWVKDDVWVLHITDRLFWAGVGIWAWLGINWVLDF